MQTFYSPTNGFGHRGFHPFGEDDVKESNLVECTTSKLKFEVNPSKGIQFEIIGLRKICIKQDSRLFGIGNLMSTQSFKIFVNKRRKKKDEYYSLPLVLLLIST
jgi:hypothetical protein